MIAQLTTIAVSVLIIVILWAFVFPPILKDARNAIEPNGKTQQVQVLTVYTAHNLLFDSRTCIYEQNATRQEVGSCLYNVGDNMTLYQTNDGVWYLQRDVKN